jgi:N-acetylglucosaminyldiphosphoundecaprenol N-acetyl-beta-D-mannosaminyltransferase
MEASVITSKAPAVNASYTNILGVPISAVDMDGAVNTIADWIKRKRRHYVCVCNVHTVMECQKDEATREVYREAGMVTPDGMPLVWVSRLMGKPDVRRVYGPDLMLEVFEKSVKEGWRHFFYGGAPGVADDLAAKMRDRFPGLQIAETICPPFRALTAAEEVDVVNRINQSGADIVWVGIGAPRQELWMAKHRRALDPSVLVGVGAAFDFLSGVKPQAPRWMMNSGLEWLFRLGSEPKRLWRRYVVYNPLFVWQVILQFAGLRRYDDKLPKRDGSQGGDSRASDLV